MEPFDALMLGVCLVIFAIISVSDYVSDSRRRQRQRRERQRQTKPLDFDVPPLRTDGHQAPSAEYQREKAHYREQQARYRQMVLRERAEHDNPELAPRASECDGLEPLEMPVAAQGTAPRPTFTLPPLTPPSLLRGLVYAEILAPPKALRRRRK